MTCFAGFTFKRNRNSLFVCVGVHEVKALSRCAGCIFPALKQASSAVGTLLKQRAAQEHAAHTDVRVSYNRRCSVLSAFLSLRMIKVV